jgi:hypothetical protein
VNAIHIDRLSREELASLIGAAVTRWLLMMPTNPAPSLAGAQDEGKRIAADDEMLKVEEAAALIRRTPRWIYRHVHKLPFVVRISPKALLCLKRGIQSWLTCKPANQYVPVREKTGGSNAETHDSVTRLTRASRQNSGHQASHQLPGSH